MSKYRRNAVVIDFNVMPSRPDMESVSRFISKGLKLDMTRTKNLQFNNSRNHVIIELGSPEEASELANRHNLKHTFTSDDQRFAVPMYVEDDAIQVRVHDLPPHMPNEIIIAHLEAYGEVKSIRNEVWREYFPGIPNGVRAVRMVLKKPIPSFIIVEEEMAYIHYPNQQKTCRHCCKPLHHGTKCNENRTSKTTPTPKAPTAPTPKVPTAPTKTIPADMTTTKTTNTATIISTHASTNNNHNQPQQQSEIVPQKTISSSASEDEENEKTIEDETNNGTAPATTTTSDHEQRTEQTKRTRPKRKRRIRNPYDPRYYARVDSLDDAKALQRDLNRFACWCETNRMVLNPGKCQTITFSRKHFPITFDYRLGDESVQRVHQVKDLGVILDTKLTFKQHLSYIISKASRQLGLVIRMTRHFTDIYCLKNLYCSLVRSTLEYCSTVWSPHYNNAVLRLESIQRRFVRYALRQLPWTQPFQLPPYENRCRLMDLDTLQLRRDLARAMTAADVLTGRIDCAALRDLIKLRVPVRQLRHTPAHQIPFRRTNYSANGAGLMYGLGTRGGYRKPDRVANRRGMRIVGWEGTAHKMALSVGQV